MAVFATLCVILQGNSLYSSKCHFLPLKTEISAGGLVGKDLVQPHAHFARWGLIINLLQKTCSRQVALDIDL